MNKKAMSLGITLLVMLTVLVLGAAIFTFLTQQNNITQNFHSAASLEKVYAREQILNFYVQNIIDRAALLSELKSKEEFILALQKEAEKYRVFNSSDKNIYIPSQIEQFDMLPELEQFEKQISADNIEIDGNHAKMRTEFLITGAIQDESGSDVLNVQYNYQRVFETEV